MSRIHRHFASDPAEVDRLAASLRDLCASVGFNPIESYQIELAASEAMVNVIRHAFHNQPGKTMTLDAEIVEGKLVLEIYDTGASIPPDRRRELIRGAAPAEEDPPLRSSLSEGGRGLQIIHDVMDEISYQTENGINRLRLVKRLPLANWRHLSG